MKKLLLSLILLISLSTSTFGQTGLGDGLGLNGGNSTEENNNNDPTKIPVNGSALIFIGSVLGTILLLNARGKTKRPN